jgi:hypothetical protein
MSHDAIAVDLGDRRLGEVLQFVVALASHPAIFLDRLFRRAFALEFGDVGARHEGLAAGARQDRQADRRVLFIVVQQFRHAQPHIQRHGVTLFRVVENDMTDAVLDMAENFFGTH